MSVPNLKSATLVVEPDVSAHHLTETSYTEIIPDVATGYAYFVEQCSVTNTGAVSAKVTIQQRFADSAASGYDWAFKRSCQINSSFNAAQGRAHILTEGQSLWAKVEAAGQEVDLVVPFTKAHE